MTFRNIGLVAVDLDCLLYASYQRHQVKQSLIEKSSINLDFSKNFLKQLSFSSKMADIARPIKKMSLKTLILGLIRWF